MTNNPIILKKFLEICRKKKEIEKFYRIIYIGGKIYERRKKEFLYSKIRSSI